MKVIVSALLAGLVLTGNTFAADKAVVLETEQQKLSYAMGLDLGKYFQGIDEKLDLEMLSRGMVDAYNGKTPLITAEESAVIQQDFAKRQQEKQIKKTVAMIDKNQKAEEAFLTENKAKAGVVATESGLQYKMVKSGEGAKPTAADMVKVHYQGTLLDGTEFDSSYKRNEPAEFQVGQVIPGWQEALQLMAVGSTYELYIPAKLAYGDRGAPPVIEPGSMLIFKVELLDILEADK